MARSISKKSATDSAVSKYYFVNVSAVGHPHRSWVDMRKYGFVSAGGGRRYSNSLNKLDVGDKIFVYQGLPKPNYTHKKVSGYVGYGIVESRKTLAADLEVSKGFLFEQNLSQSGLKHHKDDLELAEYAVRVKWIETVSSESAVTFPGIFKSRHIACNMRNLETIDFLEEKFKIKDRNTGKLIIDSIKVEKFKRLESANISLMPITVIIGENSSGKSSYLHAAQLGVCIFQEAAKLNEITQKISFRNTMSFDGVLFRPTENLLDLNHSEPATQKTGYSILYRGEFRKPGRKEKVKAHIGVFRGKNANLSVRKSGDGHFFERLASKENPASVLASGISGVSIREEWKTKPVVDAAAMRGDANLYLRAILSHLYDDDLWGKFEEVFDDCFSGAKIHMNYNKDEDRYIDVSIEYNGTVFALDLAASGMLQVIQILAYAFFYKPPLLLLDEPDVHLHEDGQMRLCNALRRIVEETDTRIVLATHSFQLVQEFENDLLAKIVLLDNGKVVKSSSGSSFDYHTLIRYGMLTIKKLEAKQGRKQVLLTEDEDVDMIKTLAIENGAMSSLQVYPYNGCKNIKYAYEIARYIFECDPDIQIFVHRDRDFRTDKEVEFESKLSRSKMHKNMRFTEIFTQYSDIEHSFLVPGHLAHVFSEDYDAEAMDELLMSEINSRWDKMMDIGGKARDDISGNLYSKDMKRHPLWQELDMPSKAPTFANLISKGDNREIPFELCRGKILIGAIKTRLQVDAGYSHRYIDERMFLSTKYLRNDVWKKAFKQS